MGEIIPFPSDDGPRPFRPDTAVGAYFEQEKSDAVISNRIPFELKRFLVAEAFESNCQFSRHVANILCQHAMSRGLHCILMAGKRREEQKAKAA